MPLPSDGIDPRALAAARAFSLARQGNADTLRQMLDAGLPVNLTNEEGNTLLMLAAYSGQAEVAQLLLSRGADPTRQDASGNTPLIAAVMMGAPRTVSRLDALAKQGCPAVD